MNNLIFNNHSDLSEYMVTLANKGKCVVAVLFYEDTVKLMKELIEFESVFVDSVDVHPSSWNNYADEYYVSLCDDGALFVEPAKVNGEYLYAGADLMLVDGNASSLILKDCDLQLCVEIEIKDECSNCEGDSEFFATAENVIGEDALQIIKDEIVSEIIESLKKIKSDKMY